MKKFITLITIISCMILFSSLPTKAMYADIANIVSTPGETMDQIGINYHTKIEGSYILYGTNSDLKMAKKVMPEVTEWSRPAGDYEAFEKRYVCKVNLTGLDLYTTYYYQVCAGKEKSDIYKFNTGLNENTTQFAWVTDSQTMDKSYNMVNDVITNLRKANPNLAFILNTGDVTDRGGKEVQWNGFFSQVNNLHDMPMASIPGNHEYYLTAQGGYISPEVYNQYFNNPQNGFEGRMNSSYFFKYNNILFIMIDAVKNEYVKEQQEWLTNVLETQTADFIICGMHAGCITGGNYASDASRMSKAFMDIFENYSVDLVLSGHEHAFCVQKTRLDGKVDEQLGVTYVIGPAVGNKTYLAGDYGMDYVQNLNYGACIIKVSSSRLTLSMYNNMGDEQYSFELPNRRKINTNYNEEKFLNSLEIKRDAEKETAELVWKSDVYGYVDEIIVSGTETNEYNERPLIEKSRKIKLSGINSLYLGGNYSDTNYKYTITVKKLNGDIVTKAIEIINNEALLINKYTVKFLDADGNILKEETINEGESATAPTAPIKDGYNFIGWDQEFDEITKDLEIKPIYEEIKVDEPKKEGCKKDLAYLTTTTIALISLGFVFLRKKDN